MVEIFHPRGLIADIGASQRNSASGKRAPRHECPVRRRVDAALQGFQQSKFAERKSADARKNECDHNSDEDADNNSEEYASHVECGFNSFGRCRGVPDRHNCAENEA